MQPEVRQARVLPRWAWALLAVVWVAYLAAVWVNQEAHEDIVAPLGSIPVILTGVLLGRRFGLWGALFVAAASFLIHLAHGAGDPPLYDIRENALRWVVGIGLGYGSGLLVDLLREQRRTTAALQREVQARNAAERTLATTQRTWQTLLFNAPDYILVIDRALRVKHVNRTPAGLAIEQVLGQPIAGFVTDPAQRVRLLDALAQAIAGGAATTLELRGPGPNGATADYRCRIVSTTDADGAPAALMMNVDITADLAAEESLRQSEERFQLAAQATRDVLWDLDVPTGRLTWGGSMTEVFGYAVADLAPDLSSWDDRIHPDDLAQASGSFTDSLKGTGNKWQTEYRFRRADGTYATVLDRAFLQRDATGNVVRAVGAMADVTLQRAAEAHAREAERMREQSQFKTQFLSNAAHELATPMTPLKLQLASLRARADQLPLAERQALDLLERNVDRMGILVNDLLDAARLQSGRIRLELKPTPLAPLAQQVAASFAEQARQAGLALAVNAPVGGLVADCDSSRIVQILFNLVHNAIKFTPRGGQIWLSLRRDGADALLEVRDSGIGMDRGQMDRLFQAFTQVHDQTKTRAGGTGLGLYVSRGIAEQHGGALAVASDGPGHGATFTLRIPLKAVDASPAPSQSAPVRPRAADGPDARRAGP